MKHEDALKIVLTLKEALDKILHDAKAHQSDKDTINRLIESNKKNRDEISRLRVVEKCFKLLQENSEIEICHQCGGEVGFIYDIGQGGCEGEVCSHCNGTGVIPKTATENQTDVKRSESSF